MNVLLAPPKIATATAVTACRNFDFAPGGNDCFRGLANWPDLDRTLEAVGKSILDRDFGAGLAAGVELARDGRLTMGVSSVAYSIVGSLAHTGAGFQWTDTVGVRWAMRIIAERPGRPSAWLALGVTLDRDARQLDPDRRHAVYCRLKNRLEALRSHRHRLTKRDYRRRTILAQRVRRMQLIDQGLKLLSFLSAKLDGNKASSVTEELTRFAIMAWGEDRVSWPDGWQAELFESLAALTQVRYSAIEIPKIGWRPKFISCGPSLQLLTLRGEKLTVRIDPHFLKLTDLFTQHVVGKRGGEDT